MPRLATPLTDLQIRKTKPASALQKLFDGGGLYLEIQPQGKKLWRFRFRQSNGKENLLTFGQYPDGRTIHAPLVQRTRSPTASMLPG